MTKDEAIARLFEARKNRRVHPDGTFDSGGRWYPSDDEHCGCCDGVRSPSRSYPWSYMVHCWTRKHCAQLVSYWWDEDTQGTPLVPWLNTQVGCGELSSNKSCARACANGVAYKLLAVDEDGRLRSVFDGSPWVIGVERKEPPRRGHGGGFYVYETPEAALERLGAFPAKSRYDDGFAKVLVRVRVGGQYCRYGEKFAFGRVTVENIEMVL